MENAGNVRTWVAVDADCKLNVSWLVTKRTKTKMPNTLVININCIVSTSYTFY